MKIGIEIGGTFTDLILIEKDREPVTLKVVSTRDDPAAGAIAGVKQLLALANRSMAEVTDILHGSTVATNALIERKGACTGLLTTEGFEDVLLIARQDKTDIYDPFYRRPEPLVRRAHIRGVRERHDADGEVLVPLDEANLLAQVAELVEECGIASLAVVFLHSYRNPEAERRARDLLAAAYPDLDISISSDIAPEFREFERTATTVVNAYVRPLVRRYLHKLVAELRALGFRHRLMIMQSNGGILPADVAATLPVRMILSGPAAGVTGALSALKRRAETNVITMDVGGTSCDVAIIAEGVPQMVSKGLSEYRIDGNPINIRMLDISTIGAGGGSIVHLDAGGMLRVGPQSAGADPGPACYGRGGTAFTVTDALLLHGLVDPARFGGGEMHICPDRALTAAKPLCRQLGITPQDLAASVYALTVSNIAQQIRRITVERGRDPAQFALMPYGGGGALFAASVAQEIGVRRVLVPQLTSTFSAFGLTVAQMRLDAVKAMPGTPLAELTHGELCRNFAMLEEELRGRCQAMGLDASRIDFARFGDARYIGQGFELTVDLPDHDDLVAALASNFHDKHTERYGHAFPGQPIELVNIRVDALIGTGGPTPRLRATAAPHGDKSGEARRGASRMASYERDVLLPGSQIGGPAILHELASAIYLPAGWQAEVGEDGVLVLTYAPDEG